MEGARDEKKGGETFRSLGGLDESKITKAFICRFALLRRVHPRSPDATKQDSSLRMCGVRMDMMFDVYSPSRACVWHRINVPFSFIRLFTASPFTANYRRALRQPFVKKGVLLFDPLPPVDAAVRVYEHQIYYFAMLP